VLAVCLILAGVLFPVFQSARSTAYKATCTSNFHQVQLATSLYLGDYDDRYMPVSYGVHQHSGVRYDRTWVQLVLPYVRSFQVFRCPSGGRSRTRTDSTFDGDLIPGDTYSQYYRASLISNVGYNYLYFSPVVRVGDRYEVRPRTNSEVGDPARTLLFIDTIAPQGEGSETHGGGNWLVTPPCRYVGILRKDSMTFGPHLYAYTIGWKPDSADKGLIYGGAWPWHNGRMTMARVDGSVVGVTPVALAAGCELKKDWEGIVFNLTQYIWDLN
jgi:prepilin-type processing-associated H-X9-DG protein